MSGAAGGSPPGGRGRRARPAPAAYQQALALLVRREHSAAELRRRLGGRGLTAEELDTALEALQGQGFQDDARYAGALLRSRAAAGQGPLRIRAELRQNGVAAGHIEAAFAAAEAEGLDWQVLAARVAARFVPALRRARGPDARRERQRALAFLLRRGFPQALARQALDLPPGEGFDADEWMAEDEGDLPEGGA
ncbi:MAG: hypothetical protein KatS3mg127_0888 [Silanimonas sp.]|nr:MAG: hypothetical protein KatS3mg127_0888 [Silanimonas sp.]